MKIMTQDRETIIEQPRQVWVTPMYLEMADENDPRGFIKSSSKRAPLLGEYGTTARAKEVLRELFEAQRRGEVSYYMPQE